MTKERQKLREIDPFTVIEYIKSSVEILMSMKEDEKKETEVCDDDQMSQMSSARIGGLSSQYEQQLQ